MMQARREHILVADDDTASLLLLKSLLKKEGFRVTTATDGEAAVAAFSRDNPDLVLLDVLMPVMDGYEAARRIKLAAGERFVPIIFLTALSNEEDLARCIGAGGDDFLTKPYSRTILTAKIVSLSRMRALYGTVRAQRDELAAYQQQMQEEQELARNIFEMIVQRWPSDLEGIRHLLRPTSLFNGDFIFIARNPSGCINVMVGDFTGHGLNAAVGSIPAAQIFYDMTVGGYALKDIVSVLDRRLYKLLPAHIFCASALMSFDPQRNTATVWNGGLPDVLVMGADATIRHRLGSRHLPLGVLGGSGPLLSLDVIELNPEDRIYLYSDGLVDLGEGHANSLGQEGLEALLTAGDADGAFDRVLAEVRRRETFEGPRDDVTLLEVICPSEQSPQRTAAPERSEATPERSVCHWRMTMELGPEALRETDPVPTVLASMERLNGIEEQRSSIFAVLSELYNNALEHGVLGLDSSLKQTADGFTRYYEERERRRAGLEHGLVTIDCRYFPQERGGKLRIRVEDSGPGFDYTSVLRYRSSERDASGRGLSLVGKLCDSVVYMGKGNQVEAVFSWRREEQ